MSDYFEWKTEEDGPWEEDMRRSGAPRSPRRPPWRVLLLVLGGLVVVMFLARWHVSQQVSTTTATIETDITAAHALVQRAAHQQDIDLLKLLISGRDHAWTKTQEDLVAGGHFGNPPFLGWTLPPPTAAENITITLSPDLRSAELQAVNTYEAVNAAGITETVGLRYTAVYRQGSDRWLYAPPEADFWGPMALQEGTYVTVIYPERDKAVATRLGQDLDDLVGRICTEVAVCAYSPFIQLRFDTEAKSVLTLVDPSTHWVYLSAAKLPAPSLVGWPVDEASYQALYRAYGIQMAAALITQWVDYDCCRREILFQGMLDWQLHQLGLKPWPLDQAVYARLSSEQSVGDIAHLLRKQSPESTLDQLQLYAFVEFLEQLAPYATLADMQRSLEAPVSLTRWVNGYAPELVDDQALEIAFMQHLYAQSNSGSLSQPPLPWPAPEIQLVCYDSDFAINFYHYDLVGQSWREALQYDYLASWATAQKVPGRPNTFLIKQMSTTSANIESQYTLLEDGKITASFTQATGQHNYFVQAAHPDGRYLHFMLWQSDELSQNFLLDVDQCRRGPCKPIPIEGALTWSPSGDHTLLHASFGWSAEASVTEWPLLYQGDARGGGLREVGRGRWPFWLDDTTYGYLRPGEAGDAELVTAVVGQDVPRPLLTADMLPAAMPADERSLPLRLSDSIVYGGGSSPMFLWLFRGSAIRQTKYFFMVTPTPGLDAVQSIHLLYAAPAEVWGTASPNGRWLVIQDNRNPGRPTLTLRNVATGAEQTLARDSYSFDAFWSSDGRWYLLPQEGYVILGAPDQNYKQLIAHDFDNCYEAYWVE